MTTLTKNQKKTFRKDYVEDGKPHAIIAEVRYDDECGNGHNSFAITATLYGPDRIPGEDTTKSPSGKTLYCYGGGCCHDEIAKHFPQLRELIKWHLCSSDGPMHYPGNVIYLAGDRDCWGMRKGEFRQHTSHGKVQNGGIEGVPNWELKIPDREQRDIYATEKPAPIVCEWVPCGRTGEGKERELKAARESAIWPEATDEQLCAEPEVLKAMLLERLPALLADFQKAVESFGFTF